MRINIYEEELTPTVELVHQNSTNGRYVGLRIYLDSPNILLDNDVPSAVTIWAEDEATLKELIHRMHDALPDG